MNNLSFFSCKFFCNVITFSYEAEYAIFVHDGTSRQASQPWVDEAVESWPDHFDQAAHIAGWAA